jgi:hypothetical protein
MRPLALSGMPAENASQAEKINWLMQAVTTIATYSRQEGSTLADPYTVVAPNPPLRTLDPGTATPAQTSAVLATFLRDMQARGKNATVKGQS